MRTPQPCRARLRLYATLEARFTRPYPKEPGTKGGGVGVGRGVGMDTRDIPTRLSSYITRLATYIQDFQLTHKTFSLPTRHESNRIQDFRLIYKTFNKLLYYTKIRPQTRHSTNILDFKPTYKTLNLNTRQQTLNISESTSNK